MEMIKKFNWRWLMMLAAVMMMGVTMTACGDDDDDDDDVVAGSLVGIWADSYDLAQGYDEVFATKINADGTGASGIWTIHSKTFTVPENDPDEEFGYYEWSFSDGVLTIAGDGEVASAEVEMSDDGKSMRLISYDEEDDEYYSTYWIRVR